MIRRRLSRLALVAGAAVGAMAGARSAEVHYDVFVTSNGTQLVIGGFDDTATTATVPVGQMRVFGGEVVPTGGGAAAAYEAASPGEPGFRAATQASLNNPGLTTPAGVFSALPGGTPLTFTFQPITIDAATRNLFFWNGTGPVSFAPVAADVVFGLTKQGGGGWTRSINGGSAEVVAGNTIQSTGTGSAAGAVHTHLFASIGKAGAAPDQGFYLSALQLQVAGLAASDPIYFVFGALDPAAMTSEQLLAFEAAHGSAEAWVDATLVPVPEPAGLAMAGAALAGCAGAMARRRNRGRFPG
jgi:hypothetical protein